MKILNSTPSFKGYKNILTNDINDKNLRLLMMSVQLDDEYGFRDLSELKQIRSMAGIPHDNDILTFTYAKLSNNQEFIKFNESSLHTGDELYELWDKYHALSGYKNDERITLKAYSLIASITKRIVDGVPGYKDDGIRGVYTSAFKSLRLLINNEIDFIFNYLQATFFIDKAKELKCAQEINKIVVENMRKFLKY